MKTVVLSLVLFAWSALAEIAVAVDVETELNDLLAEFLAAASINDRSMHERFWDEDLVYTSSDGQRFGKAAILESLDAQTAQGTSGPRYSADRVRVIELDRSAVVTFRLLAETEGEPTQYYYNTGVFKRRDGRWQAIVWQATRAQAD